MPGEEVVPDDIDDHLKVYVSRLPLKWRDSHLAEHFQACFGAVRSATIKWDSKNDCSLGYGFVVFEEASSREKAIEQGSIHANKRTIQIKQVVREEGILGRGRDGGICHLWIKNACVKGDECKFLHDGPGSCVVVSAPGEGISKKKCLSFKSKGKCSKGNDCPFLHIQSTKTKDIGSMINLNVGGSGNGMVKSNVKICHSFEKKGKCRKGNSCIFAHNCRINPILSSENVDNATVHPGSSVDSIASLNKDRSDCKRKRIDGQELVLKRQKMLTQTFAT
jgi:hypothetical protein